ncbi:MAG: CpaF family protein [Nitrospiraceae bacterium]|nr:CpaF family protein [Nitrospiraceae bacterium]
MEIKETYSFKSENIPVNIKIGKKKGEYVPSYEVNVANISHTTERILERIRDEIINKVTISINDIINEKKNESLNQRIRQTISKSIEKHFPDVDERTREFLTSYLVQKSLGLGSIELLMSDPNLEEIAINNADEPIWVYHRKYGWLKTNIFLKDEAEIQHYATIIGRKVGRQINILEPLMDANLSTGDRVNATLKPITLKGNTITLRKFASKPWTITDFIKAKTIDEKTAALIWEAVQYELSILIAGGTAAGKTSMLNVVSNFFPPNQRIISIEDTHELQLPKYLHWLPMLTRSENAEGKGSITMLDLLVNSLRMRPDRIMVGEIRRKEEAQVLFEAIHTGHSVYATVHANDAEETITRLTNPPISIAQSMVPAISMIIVQYRNRRTGKRRTFQIAEITKDCKANIIRQYDIKKDKVEEVSKSKRIYGNLNLFAGLSEKEVNEELNEKAKVLKWLVSNNINTVDSVGRVMAEYYTNKEHLLKVINKNEKFDKLEEE